MKILPSILNVPSSPKIKKKGLYDLYSVETEREALIGSSLFKNPSIYPSFFIFLFMTFNFDVLQSHLSQK